MTTLLPAPPVAHRPPAARSVVPAALVAAGWAAGVGLSLVVLVALVSWAADAAGATPASAAVRTGAMVWLAAHHVPVAVPGGRVAVTPLGLSALCAALLYRSGVGVGRARPFPGRRALGVAVGALSVGYGALAAAVAGLAARPGAHPFAVAALGWATLLAAGFGGAGVLRGSGTAPVVRSLLPRRARVVLAAAAAALLAIGAVGALLGAAGLAAHAARAGELTRALAPTAAGQLVLAVVELALLPNVLVLGASYAAGAGFAVGAGTAVSPFTGHLGPLPALPLLAAVPGPGAPAGAPLLLALPALTGLVAGAVVVRRLPAGGPAAWGGCAAAAGAVVAITLGALGALAGGAAGPGRLAPFGPSPWRLAAAGVLLVAAPASGTAAGWWWLRRLRWPRRLR